MRLRAGQKSFHQAGRIPATSLIQRPAVTVAIDRARVVEEQMSMFNVTSIKT